MTRDTPLAPERVALLLMLATLLFVGALRSFFTAIYYQNLASLGLNATALYALLLLAPLVLLVPALRRAPGATIVAGVAALGVGRALLPATRGTPVHLPAAGLAVAGYLVLLGALLPRLRRAQHAWAGAGIALGWALDVALVTLGESSDPTAGWRGLVLVAPVGVFALWLARGIAPAPEAPEASALSVWDAGLAWGAWLFAEHVVLGNPYGTARWNSGAPLLFAVASTLGLLAGALLLALRPRIERWQLWALNLVVVAALADHAYLHSPVIPLLVLGAQAALVVDLALITRGLAHPHAPGAMALGGLLALILHFVYAFTFLFHYVPLGETWEGRAPLLFALAALLVPYLARGERGGNTWPRAASGPRPMLVFALAPLLVLATALATPGAAVPEAREGGALRVMTFNVHQGFANDGVLDPDVFVEVLREQDADVVLLQESDTPRFTSGNLDIATYLAQKAGYRLAYGQPTREQAFGGAVLSRFPIREWRVQQLPSGSDDRFYTEARLDVAGRDVWVYAVHFALPREDRVAQAEVLLALSQRREGPRIVGGDLNSCPTGLCPDEDTGLPDRVYERMTGAYRDALVAAGGNATSESAHTYDATAPYERIDYLFVTGDFDVLAYDRVRTEAAVRASDHLPVMAELRLR